MQSFWRRSMQWDLPQGYTPGNAHQDYVDRRMAKLNPQQRARIGQLWAEKQGLDPDMPNRGISFVKIMEFVSAGEKMRPTLHHPPFPPTKKRETGRKGVKPAHSNDQTFYFLR